MIRSIFEHADKGISQVLCIWSHVAKATLIMPTTEIQKREFGTQKLLRHLILQMGLLLLAQAQEFFSFTTQADGVQQLSFIVPETI